MSENLTLVEREVLCAAADVACDLEQIYLRLKSSAHPIPLAETADAVRALVSKGLLVPVANGPTPAEDASFVWKDRFEPTEQGREGSSEQVPEAASISNRPSLFGIWKDQGIKLKAEDLAEARREMWENFPRDFPK